jgi:hypothetical protein
VPSWVPAAIALIALAAVSAGPLAAPVAAATPTDVAAHGLGWVPTPQSGGVSPAAVTYSTDLGSYPSSADLSAWDAPVGNQGQIGSCASWATGYYYRYWLRNHAYGETATYAPMYLYTQLAHGNSNNGTTFPDNFAIMAAQGIDRGPDYPQGNYDYTTQPTAAEITAAAPYKIASYSWVFSGASAGNQAAIEATLSGGKPMVIGVPVYDNFYSASVSNPLIGVPTARMTYWGGHALFVAKYDASGVWVENSWGTGWGSHGWGELSWAFVNQYAWEGWTMSGDTARAPAATHLSVAFGAGPSPAGSSHSIIVKALDASSNVATGYAGTVHFTASDANATLPADYTFTPSDKGVHTFFGVIIRTAGSQWVRATDRSTGSVTGSQTATVAPAVASTLAVSSVLNPYPAGTAHSVQLAAYDAYGNVATGYRGTVHFTTSDAKASVPANYTFTASDKGVHTFSNALRPGLTFKTAGSQWLRATDIATATITGVKNGIVVRPGGASSFKVAVAVNPYPKGTAHSVTVTAFDAYGNVATGYTGTVHFTTSDAKASVPADYKFTAADGGSHNFASTLHPGLAFRTAGSRWIRVTDVTTPTTTGAQTGILVR